MPTDKNEEILSAWLRLSASLWNERLVSDMPFNEAFICNLLSKNSSVNPQKPMLSATELCGGTGMHKSQMNRTLNNMEKKGNIIRLKSESDKRVSYIMLTPKGRAAYHKEHARIMEIVNGIVSKIGDEKAGYAADIFNLAADAFKQMEGQ